MRTRNHNSACQLVHAAIRKTAKGGDALYSAPDLVLVMADTGTKPLTTGDRIEIFSSTPEELIPQRHNETLSHDWFAPLPKKEEISSRRHTDVSQDPRYIRWGLSAAEGDAECAKAPRRTPT